MATVEQLDTILSFYARPGIMTDPGEYLPLFQQLPGSTAELVKIVQGVMLHVFWAESYGVKIPEERQAELQIRPVRPKLARIFELDPRPLNEARPPECRLVGNCRDYSVMLAAMFQAKGVPARARCGFGTYFIPGHYEDHWMVEYWQADSTVEGGRWVQVDAQIDALQRGVLSLSFDTLDMPHGAFVTGGAAWLMCRRGEANPDDFGIFDMKGWDFIKNDLLLDLRAMNKVELLPWDVCGLAQVEYNDLTPAQFDLLDRIAALTLGGNAAFEELRVLYEENDELCAPAEMLP